MTIQELRSHRIFGLAIFDLVVAMVGLAIIFVIFQQIHFKRLSAWKFALAGVILAIPVGIAFHIIFGTNTQLNYDLGLSYAPAKSV